MKPDLQRCFNLLDAGFSLVTVGSEKIPNIKWKELQTKPLTKDSFENFYNLSDNHHTKATEGVGIITGYNNLEAIDVDLKVLDTLQEKEFFWNEYLEFLKDNIEDFETKFVIVKTKNGGYHILYRCKKIAGNVKIAVPKSTEKKAQALIESRGVGGYVFIYDNFVQGGSYNFIAEISEEDREILWRVSRTYNHVQDHEPEEKKYKDVHQDIKEADIKVWDDYNQKVSVWDLVKNEFIIIRKLSNKTIIKRNNSKSPHSGYIFENSKCMYLFSTGTQYPHETLLSPFHVYAIQRHNGNFSDTAKALYKDGYGSRIKKNFEKNKEHEEINIKTDSFPLSVYPDNIQLYISEVHKSLNASIDYLGSSLLWVLSVCVGNSMKLEVKRGWVESGVIWLALVGKAGIGKTHNIGAVVRPLKTINAREIIRYKTEIDKFQAYQEMSKEQKKVSEEIQKPVRNQFIVNDITIEALLDHHEHSKNGIGILRDELSGWIKDLNKYRPGSDLETYLSCWSNETVIINRKTAKDAYVHRAFVPIIGGVQPSILTLHYTPENKENGFIDRILLCYPELEVEKYCDNEIDNELMEWFDNYIIAFYELTKNKHLFYDDNNNIKPYLIRFSPDAKKEWIRIFNKITDMQNSESENEYMKSILPKQKSYVCRFALLLNVLYSYDDGSDLKYISKKAILGAEKLSDYFIKMAKKNKFESIESTEIKQIIKHSGKLSIREQFNDIFAANPNINQSKIAEQLNVSRHTIRNWMKDKKSV